jgi:hypothetical protein
VLRDASRLGHGFRRAVFLGRRQSHVKPASGWQVRRDHLPERVFIKIKFQEGTGNLNYSATSDAVPR